MIFFFSSFFLVNCSFGFIFYYDIDFEFPFDLFDHVLMSKLYCLFQSIEICKCM